MHKPRPPPVAHRKPQAPHDLLFYQQVAGRSERQTSQLIWLNANRADSSSESSATLSLELLPDCEAEANRNCRAVRFRYSTNVIRRYNRTTESRSDGLLP
jgi:hypothetical protein